jgi:SAM-dependent methyltransferase
MNEIEEKFGGQYVVTPSTFIMGIHHRFAEDMAKRFVSHRCVLDACTGAGFAAIPVARLGIKVIAVDINSEHLDMARKNASIAGVEANMAFILGDITSDETLQKVPPIDGAILDPDWATGENKRAHIESLSQMQPRADLLFQKVCRLTPNIALRLPKEMNLGQLDTLPPHELEEVCMDGRRKFYWAYFGNLSSPQTIKSR